MCIFRSRQPDNKASCCCARNLLFARRSRERDRHKTKTFNLSFAEMACKPLERTDDVQQRHTGRAAQHTRRRTVLPQAAPHRRQKRCKLFGMQSVSDSRRVIADYDPKVHLAPWHNDRPFVLGLYNRRTKKCWDAIRPSPQTKDSSYVIRS